MDLSVLLQMNVVQLDGNVTQETYMEMITLHFMNRGNNNLINMYMKYTWVWLIYVETCMWLGCEFSNCTI